MQSLAVRLFAPGLSAAGEPASAWFTGVGLCLESGGRRDTIPAAQLRLRSGGFDGDQWLIEWPVDTGMAAIQLPTGTATLSFLAAAPPALAAQVTEHAGRTSGRRWRLRFGMALIGLLLLLPLLLLGAYWFNADRISGWAARHVTLAQEQRLGALAYAQLVPSLRLHPAGPANDLVRALGQRLTEGSRYRYQWLVADSPEINAFALPGGYVVVYTGLLKAAGSVDEVAGVLAHEVQHVEQRHSLKTMLHDLGWRAVLALALGDVSGGVWGDLPAHLGSLAYGRDLERQADLEGLRALRRAGIAGDGLIGVFARLARLDVPAMEMLASHPTSQERLATLRSALAAQPAYASHGPGYDWAAVRGDL
jgi:Zn-dependent protease with chaperone function